MIFVTFKGCNEKVSSESKIGFIDDHRDPKSWKEATNESCIPQYQTATIVEERARQNKPNQHFSFTIGIETSCEGTGYCNGPLKPGKKYALTMRFFTKTGFADSDYIKIVTEKEVPLFLITILTLSVMCIVFVVGLFISYRRTKTLRYEFTKIFEYILCTQKANF